MVFLLLDLNASNQSNCSYYWTSMPPIKPVNWTAILATTQSNQSTNQPSWPPLNQSSQRTSHPGCHSIKPVNEPAILAATQSNQSTNQPSWPPLNQTSQRTSHPGRHSIKQVSESWRPIGRLKGGSGGGRSPPRKEVTATVATVSQQLSPFGRALGASRPGTEHPMRGIPHFDDRSKSLIV